MCSNWNAHQAKVVDEAVADGRDETLEKCVAEECAVILFIYIEEGLVEEGKRDHSVDVQHHKAQSGHPQQSQAYREGRNW